MVSRGKSFGKGRKGDPPTYKIVKRPLPPEGIEVQQARREQELEGQRERKRIREKQIRENTQRQRKVQKKLWLTDRVRKWQAQLQCSKMANSMHSFHMVLRSEVREEFISLHDRFQIFLGHAERTAAKWIVSIGQDASDIDGRQLLEELTTIEQTFTKVQSALKSKTRKIVVKSEELKLKDSRKNMSGWVEHFSVTFPENTLSARLFSDLQAYWGLLSKSRSNLQEELKGIDRLNLDLHSLPDPKERIIIAKQYESMKQQMIQSQMEHEDHLVKRLEFAEEPANNTM